MLPDANRQADFEREKEYEAEHLREQQIEARIQTLCENPEVLIELIDDYVNEKNIGDTYVRLLHAVLTTPYYKTIQRPGKSTEFAVTQHIKRMQDLMHTAVKEYAITLVDRNTG